MSSPPTRSRVRRRAAVASTSLAVVASSTLLALSGGQGSWAAPAEDCTEAFPVAEVAQGDAVTGLTVSDGTDPEGFRGEVIGVLENGIAPDLDMVLARLSSPEIDRVGGIWQGMSGSPVYAADGRLIGAVSYGLSWGPSPVAGITPFEEMDDYLGDADAPARVDVDGRTARAVAASSDVSATQAGEGLTRLPMPVSVSGLSAQRLAQVQEEAAKHAYLGGKAVLSSARVARGGTGAVAADVDDLVAGGNLAAAVYHGDVSAVGVGTVTSVCGDRVVGFGHPFSFAGETTLSLHPAEALHVQEESLGAPFKVANAGAPVGTVTDDRLAGITSTVGPLPDSATVTSTVSFEGRSRTGSTEVNLDGATAETTLFGVLVNHDRVLDGTTGGTEVQTVEITGTDGSGRPFAVSYADRYTEQRDLAFGTIFDVAYTAYSLSRLGGVDLDSVTVDSEVVDDTSVSRVTTVERRVGGDWINLGRRNKVTAGSTLRLRVTVGSSDGSGRTERFALPVPRSAGGDDAYLAVGGGGGSYYGRSGGTLQKVLAGLEDRVRNDQVSASIGTYQRRERILAQAVGEPGDEVVRGGHYTSLRVMRG